MTNPVLNSIMGLCVADALGVPVEFRDRDSLMKDPVIDMREYGTYNQPAGIWSDDTSMTLCLVYSLSKGLDYNDIMTSFMKWFRDGEYTPFGEAFDIGIGTHSALMRFEDGTQPLECGGKSEYDNGNGSLMRILPIVFYLESIFGAEFYEIDDALDIIHNISSLTHAHKRSHIACGIYILIAAKLLEGVELSVAVKEGINNAMNYYKMQDDFTKELGHFERLERVDLAQVSLDEISSSGYVVDTLEASIWCLLNTFNYKDCVLKAVNLVNGLIP